MKRILSRRAFLTGKCGGCAGGLLVAKTVRLEAQPLPRCVAPSDRVRFGMIGIGMQGSGLLGGAITIPGVECVAAADLYDGRHTLAKEITGNTSLPTTRNYQELLDRKDIDCIVAAVPDHWHRRVVVDACNAGKDIYCEKPMSHNVADGLAMVEAAQKNNRIVQIGSQRVSSVLCAKARELYAGGAIGDVEMVELTLGRNDPTGAWEYPPPPDLSPETLDWDTWLNDAPKVPFNKLHFARWRCWRAYGTGVAGDLMVHLISGMLVTLGWNEIPRSATAMGGIFRFQLTAAICPTSTPCSSTITAFRSMCGWTWGARRRNWRASWARRVFSMPASSNCAIPRSRGWILDPSYYASVFPAKMREEYFKQWHAEHDPPLGKEPLREDTVYKGHDWDDMRPHLNVFFQSVKSRKPVTENAGVRQPCRSRLSYGERVVLPPEARHLGRGFENHQVVDRHGWGDTGGRVRRTYFSAGEEQVNELACQAVSG